MLKRRTPGDTPIVQSGVAPLVSLVSLDTQLSQIGNLRSGLLPLLPDVHSEPAPHPFNPRHQRPLPTAERVVVFHHLVVLHMPGAPPEIAGKTPFCEVFFLLFVYSAQAKKYEF